MLDIARLERIRLTAKPLTQRLVGFGILAPTYEPFGRVRIDVENMERIPDEPVIYAMNHTDRYNYWPFQYALWRRCSRFTATWVKGKYYENPVVGLFMERTNNLPTVSRGYIITRDFLDVVGRRPTEEEYTALRARVDAAAQGDEPSSDTAPIPAAVLRTPRSMLGRRFDPATESWAEAVNAVFATMMRRFLELHEEAFALGLDLIVFPEGTRRRRLGRGHIGLAEVALKYRKTVVPVGCSGSDRVYPGSSPIARPGHIVYRVGEPVRYEDVSEFHIDEPFTPFDARDEAKHRGRFQGYVDAIMARIEELLDEPYRSTQDPGDDEIRGTQRFV